MSVFHGNQIVKIEKKYILYLYLKVEIPETIIKLTENSYIGYGSVIRPT